MNINNEQYFADPKPIDEACNCPACRSYSRSYIRHLFKAREALGMRLCVIHNLYFYNELMAKIREALDEGRFEEFYRTWVNKLAERSEDWSALPEKFIYKVKMSRPESIVPICVKEGIDLGVPKVEKKKKKNKKAEEASDGE